MNLEIRYTLTAEVDGVEVYMDTFPDTTMLQEDGLRKAEHAVEHELKYMTEDDYDGEH